MTRPLRIVFAGTPDFAAVALAALLDSPHHVAAVYTQPDRPAGRGRRLTPSPVKRLAGERGLPVEQPASLRSAEAQAALRAHAPEVMVVAAYGLLLPPAVLALPPLGCVNIHASLLPRWRGAAPIQRAVLAGDRESGVSIMQMDEGLDTGPVLLARTCPMGPRITAGELHDALAPLGAEALLAALDGLAAGTLAARPQDEARATRAPKVTTAESWLDWTCSSAALDRQVRAFHPVPVARTRAGDTLVKVHRAEPLAGDPGGPPGTVTAAGEAGVEVACGEGRLRLTVLQLPGGRPLAAGPLLRGHGALLAPGTRLGPPLPA